ncbi:hypothetical protein LY625_01760 [Lysobacter sp. GX 14042]|uniref:hypothetical protein n=1 Tax=Lysobacter sp. GX 14042 TaxID=2907155 RepID=UPI001F2ADF91|nr:hypothetical protein [Lysobacter sp. GX 14042]MCE7031363.1 hypothetical protein [Lysobacter sp. GX 14042]
MHRIITAAALLLFAGSALAQTGTVYRCKGDDGSLALQSHPCGPDQTVEAATNYRPERLTRAQEDAIRQRNLYRPVQQQGAQSGGTAAVIRQRTDSACATARAYRDQAYRNNPKMGYEARQSLGNTVRNACK